MWQFLPASFLGMACKKKKNMVPKAVDFDHR